MTTNIKLYAIGATEKIHYGRLDVVTEDYPAGDDGVLANGEDQSMLTYKGFATYTDTPANAEAVSIQADAGNIGTMFSRALDNATGAMTFATFDAIFQSIVEDLNVYSDDDYEKVGIDDAATVLNKIAMIINNHATSLEAASLDEQGWAVIEIFKTTAEKGDSSTSGTDFAAQPQSYNLVFDHATKDMDNVAITDGNYNRTKLRGQVYWSENPIIRHTFIGDGTTDTVTLTETPIEAAADKIRVKVDGVALTYTTDYAVVPATKILTFEAGAIPANAEVAIIQYEYDISLSA